MIHHYMNQNKDNHVCNITDNIGDKLNMNLKLHLKEYHLISFIYQKAQKYFNIHLKRL